MVDKELYIHIIQIINILFNENYIYNYRGLYIYIYNICYWLNLCIKVVLFYSKQLEFIEEKPN